ncbi:hypothetical protein Kpol_534p7 [Vanderwaltozyma polyspora DSM 70294]|uniref:Transcription factor Iwr1 domain-containing protein n=1 Tax=Vanderwaltozyma polyspora (strain ATCC 22028 / DSM 70294 / BCRC 21397 / CBS 2163 / NBRC 10782 / NRRL Y-8283 / UCD 57-17) TaxID=436907 RepID=A7TJI5_VANPO|nr:uncharacterized protein Kpol_534p7 [Vanderwaltozyma polyspora DSM 70294]EDO17528.1 hypothetical protein Kpol_534p7 [Vanderwaltozyma polyspora DSM 70294]
MLAKYLQLNNDDSVVEESRKKPSRKHFKGDAARIATLPSLDYVYDIYRLENMKDEDEQLNRLKIGRVKIVNIDTELVHDEESDDNGLNVLEDDDSNDENYYRNDYPEDEDDDRSILFGSDGEEAIAEEETWIARQYEEQRRIQQQNETGHGDSVTDDYQSQDGSKPFNPQEYSGLFAKFNGSVDILKSINSSNFIDMDGQLSNNNDNIDDDDDYDDDDDDDDVYDASDYEYHVESDSNSNEEQEQDQDQLKRNEFFSTDQDDPLAIHRDKIFGKLQRMIDER